MVMATVSFAKTVTTSKQKVKVSTKKSGGKSVKGKKASSRRGAWKRRGQQAIASERTMEIQQALVKAGYLKSAPSGLMDDATKQALKKFQADNGWQSKVVPDSRALIQLGLGPDHSNLLNPDTAVLPAISSNKADAPAGPQ